MVVLHGRLVHLSKSSTSHLFQPTGLNTRHSESMKRSPLTLMKPEGNGGSTAAVAGVSAVFACTQFEGRVGGDGPALSPFAGKPKRVDPKADPSQRLNHTPALHSALCELG